MHFYLYFKVCICFCSLFEFLVRLLAWPFSFQSPVSYIGTRHQLDGKLASHDVESKSLLIIIKTWPITDYPRSLAEGLVEGKVFPKPFIFIILLTVGDRCGYLPYEATICCGLDNRDKSSHARSIRFLRLLVTQLTCRIYKLYGHVGCTLRNGCCSGHLEPDPARPR